MRDEKVIYILLGGDPSSAIQLSKPLPYAVSRTSATQGQGGGAREYDPRQLDSRNAPCRMHEPLKTRARIKFDRNILF